MASRLLTTDVVGSGFAFYTDEEVRRMSVKQVTNPQTFDSFGRATPSGTYDAALGPVDYKEICPTCSLGFQECPGHMGHIELCVPVYNPTLFPLLYKVLRLKCFACHKLRIASSRATLLRVKLMLLDLGRYEEAMSLDSRIAARPLEQVLAEMSSGKGGKHRPGAGAKYKAKAKAASSKEGEEDAGAAMAEDVAHEESVEAALDRQARMLSDLETDCLAAGGPDVGLGLLGCGAAAARAAAQGGIASASPSPSRAGPASSGVSGPLSSQHLREYREQLIKEFLASFPAKSCHNCGGPAVPIKKDGHAKLFLKPLPRESLITAASSGIVYRSGTAILAAREAAQKAAEQRAAARAARRAALKAAAAAGKSTRSGGAVDIDIDGDDDDVPAAGDQFRDVLGEQGFEEDELGLFGIRLAALDGSGGDEAAEADEASAGKQRYIAASEVAAQLQLMWETEWETLRRVFLPLRSAPLGADGATPLVGGATSTSAAAMAGAAAQGVGLRSLLPRPYSRATLAQIAAGRAGAGAAASASSAAVTSLAVRVDHAPVGAGAGAGAGADRPRPSFSLHTPGYLPLPHASGDAASTSSSSSGAGSGSAVPHPSAGWRFFFLRVVPVPASRFRPPQLLNEAQYEHAQNAYLSKILKANDTLTDLGMGATVAARAVAAGAAAAAAGGAGLHRGVDLRRAIATWMDLQNNVNGLFDSTKATSAKGTALPNGIRQLLEKKEGMMRKNMMGKRVNFAARSVISPDPFLRADQVGVPVRFAKTLTFKQPVNRTNARLLSQLVRNGASVWPGASHVEFEDGTVVDLAHRDARQRDTLAKLLLVPPEATPLALGAAATGMGGVRGFGASGPGGVLGGAGGSSGGSGAGAALLAGSSGSVGSITDTAAAGAIAAVGGMAGTGVKRVWRHLLDDDIVLMNRQPTLHKPSVMAHRARVMRHWSSQQTIRFHYANCKTYNADFDGDEVSKLLHAHAAPAVCCVPSEASLLHIVRRCLFPPLSRFLPSHALSPYPYPIPYSSFPCSSIPDSSFSSTCR